MLGVCCMWLDLDERGKFVNMTPCRNLQLSRLGSYDEEVIKSTYLNNLTKVEHLLKFAIDGGVQFVRISSSLFPLFDKVPRYLWHNEEVIAALQRIGHYAAENKMRINTHPSQYFVLSSEKEHVVATAIRELNFHGWLFDQMKLPRTSYYNINVHGGKRGRSDALVAAIERLDASARQRLTLENCEFSYTVQDLANVSRRTGVPVVVDVHHHGINPGGLTTKEALELGRSTWPADVRPTTHLSNSRPGFENESPAKRRAHSDYIAVFQPDLLEMHQSEVVDVEVEAKAKNLAIANLKID